MFSICFAADCVCCAWMSRLLSSVLSLLLSDPAPPASHCAGAGAGAVCHLPLIFCHAPPLPPPTPRPPLSGSSTAEGLITVSVCSNRHSCLLNIILSPPVCCPVCCSLLTVNICQLGDCVTVSEAADVLVTTVPTLRTQADFLLPDKLLPCMYYLLFLFILFIIVYLWVIKLKIVCVRTIWIDNTSIQKWNKQIPKIIVSISSDKW